MGVNIIMLGAPGAGKGTQADVLAGKRRIPKISTGDILRQGIKDQLPVAMVAKAKMDRGELVDDDTMIAIVRERLSRSDVKPWKEWDSAAFAIPWNCRTPPRRAA